MIWETIVPRQATQERAVGCDFHPPMQSPDTCFLYSYQLPRETWFYQDPDKDHVYWISISAMYQQEPPQQYVWGWKTRPQSVIDAAVRIKFPTAPQLESKFETGEPIMDFEEPWDMAFVLTTPAYDYGDAPDAGYRTLLASNGARHIYWPNGPFMGVGVDTEPDGQPGLLALGDDNNATDDEDGVTIHGPWVIDQAARFSVDMTASPCSLQPERLGRLQRQRSWDTRSSRSRPMSRWPAGVDHTLASRSRPTRRQPRHDLTPASAAARRRAWASRRGGRWRGGRLPRRDPRAARAPVVTTSIVNIRRCT